MNNDDKELLDKAAEALTGRLAEALKLNAPSRANLVKLLPFFLADHEVWKDPRQFAYGLATPYHETGKLKEGLLVRFAPISETHANPNRQPGLYAQQQRYWPSGYYGRGLVQITWKKNYEQFEALTGKPLIAQPDLALELETAYIILREGMHKGIFTGRKLSHYINGTQCDFVNARRIINGHDRAEEIARIANLILGVLTS